MRDCKYRTNQPTSKKRARERASAKRAEIVQRSHRERAKVDRKQRKARKKKREREIEKRDRMVKERNIERGVINKK